MWCHADNKFSLGHPAQRKQVGHIVASQARNLGDGAGTSGIYGTLTKANVEAIFPVLANLCLQIGGIMVNTGSGSIRRAWRFGHLTDIV